MKKKKIKTIEHFRVTTEKIGYLDKNGVNPEPGEERTFKYLTLFGFNVELIRPIGIKKVKNPDVFIMGSIWEVKTPTSSSESTIKKRFREAAKQANKIIFDLRFVIRDHDKVKRQILDMFLDDGNVRRLMIIEKDGKLLDFIK